MVKSTKHITKDVVFQVLHEVKDPEIPVLSLVDLGVIRAVEIEQEEDRITIEMTPTFAGCPAIDHMKDDIVEKMKVAGMHNVIVNVNFNEQWNTNMISEEGRKALKHFGISPPPKHNMIIDLDILEQVECPHCKSHDTTTRSIFGSTLCRSSHVCNSCHEFFEQFKPI